MHTIKKSIAVLLALVLSLSVVFCFACSPVSAAETFELPLEPFSYNVSDSFIKPIIESAYNKSIAQENNYFLENSYFFYNSNNVFLVLKDDITTTNKQFAYYYRDMWLYRPVLIFSKGIVFNSTASNTGSLFTSVQSGNATTFGIVDVNPNPFNYSRYYVGGLYYDANYGHYSTLQLNSNFPTYFETSYIPPYVPPSSVLYGLDLDINETDFYNWIMDNNKLVDLPNYITANKLMSFIQFYKKFGGSFTNFLKNIPDWFSYMNIVNQSTDNVNVLKSSMDKLFQEYVNTYWHAIYPDFSGLPHHRRNIQTNTTDTNNTLITDDSDDTVDTSILRDILRGIISINNSISDGFIAVINKLTGLVFTVNVANNGGSNDIDNSLSIDYAGQGNFGIDEIHQYEPLPEAPDIDGDVDFLDYPAVLAQSTNAFFNLLPSDMSALMSAVLVLGVLITKIGR